MLKFWELAPSPNNLKVRMALRFKGIEFEAIPVDPLDRSEVTEASGQELTPVIAEREIVLNDSEAILQYLDANHPETPRLFPADRAGRYSCDAWKRELDERIARHWLPVFLVAIGRSDTFEGESRDAYHRGLEWLDEEIGDSDHVRDGAPIDQLRVAEWAVYALPGPGLLKRVHLFRRFQEMYAVPAGSLPNLERVLRPWQQRLW